ncbi:SGNH/GDSL hydrolase family protein [Kriegella aquimaris]|uniref:GDSL-like Lipase/Acylhydrolase family n=1 Tax=Kriegella aquimaris TaxID=192904 RepID=A0A1G9TNS7_9FLAO|nr:SGNH/GDSL hydrolase family protein [Kriegella aquimaris]SDM49302.1 GDSL-like Lipase/Acylhydrolase family [Kriegella aquimaris]
MKHSILQKIFFLTTLLLCLSISAQERQLAKVDVFKMKEFHLRDGLPNVFHKIATQRQVRIGYLGGSITEAREGWRDLSFSWFRLNFPKTAFYQNNAAIGGTGSDLGVFRLEDDVFDEKPDLLFVEFAVNDGHTPTSLRTMEGIVRKTWAAFPNTDICFIYTTAEVYCRAMVDEGKTVYAVDEHEKVAAHYGIPSINVGLQVARMYAQGELLLSADPSKNERTIVFTKDRTHPLPESGHPLYGSLVAKYLDKMSKTAHDKKHVLSAPYTIENWQAAKMIDISQTEQTGTWKKLEDGHDLLRKFISYMPSIYQAKPRSSMRFKFKGTVLGFYDCVGPGTGSLEITVDGKKQEKLRFDQWSNNYRKSSFFVEGLKDGVHEVEVRVLEKKLDKADILSKKKITIDDPVKYKGLDWYAANIMIVGELLK